MLKEKIDTVLLVDDDDADNFFHTIVIGDCNCVKHVQAVENGEDALEYLQNAEKPTPQLILLDINMPRMDGWEFLEEYEKLPAEQKAEVTVVMLTTSLNPYDKEKADNLEMVKGFYNKPLTEESLAAILKEHFKHRM